MLTKEIINSKSINSKIISNSKVYDLEERTLEYAKEVRRYFKSTKIVMHTLNDVTQILRSSGSIGANYIEANEALSKKDFLYRIRICKKETKETRYWLYILNESYNGLGKLIKEGEELQKIFGAIYEKSK